MNLSKRIRIVLWVAGILFAGALAYDHFHPPASKDCICTKPDSNSSDSSGK